MGKKNDEDMSEDDKNFYFLDQLFQLKSDIKLLDVKD